jgi:hypothetical protein
MGMSVSPWAGVVLEFLLRGADDAVCDVRGTSRGGGGGLSLSLGGSPVDKQLAAVRRSVGWLEVPAGAYTRPLFSST